jgi:hypothetical protein
MKNFLRVIYTEREGRERCTRHQSSGSGLWPTSTRATHLLWIDYGKSAVGPTITAETAIRGAM